MKKQKQRSENGARKTDRTSIILSMFREFPNNKFSLKHLASASGGATKEGRRETLEILGRLFEEGVVDDSGPIIAQRHVPIYDEDTVDELEERVHECEHILFPQTIKRVLNDRIAYEKGSN